MNQIHAEASDVIEARPEEIYAVLSDYRVGHPAILPRQFTELSVEEGGQGAGTVTRVRMKVMGKDFAYHQLVSEPEPGRLLVETDIETGQYSSFTLEPLDEQHTRVTIASETPASPGFMGVIEKLFNPPVAQRIYKQELRNLADYLRSQQASN